jgi:hypothetical protein
MRRAQGPRSATIETERRPGYLIMDIAMLRGIKERAERYQAA